jgi:hypothetical protein
MRRTPVAMTTSISRSTIVYIVAHITFPSLYKFTLGKRVKGVGAGNVDVGWMANLHVALCEAR